MIGAKAIGFSAISETYDGAITEPFLSITAPLTLTMEGHIAALPDVSLETTALITLTASSSVVSVERSCDVTALMQLTVVDLSTTSENGSAVTALVELTANSEASSGVNAEATALVKLTATSNAAVGVTSEVTALLTLQAGSQISVPVTIATTALLNLTAESSIVAVALADAVAAYIVNTTTGGHASYTNYGFNSFFELGGSYYGCSDTGVIKLDGTADGTTPISWEVTTPITDLGASTRKYVPDARLVIRSNGELFVAEIVDEQTVRSNITILSDDAPGVHTRRIKLPRGLTGTNWQFKVYGSGNETTIKSLEVTPVYSGRSER